MGKARDGGLLSSWSAPLRQLPGALLSCLLLTLLTVLLAICTGNPTADATLRPLYFALLFGFFRGVGRRYEHIRGLPMRLVEAGFLVLTLGFTTSAVLTLWQLDSQSALWTQLHLALERGAVFLLGISLISYGLILLIPQLLEHHRLLRMSFARTRGQLQVAESARSRMEQRLVDADRLGILGQLAAGVAHDLRNPLAIIKGTVESMRRKRRSGTEVAEHIEVICRSVEKADRTIEALIDLGRPRSSQRTEVPLRELVQEVLALVLVGARHRRLQVDTAGCLPLDAVGDRAMLVQLLLNLVLNAVQASPDGATIRLRTRALRLHGNAAVVLMVEDRGVGLPDEVRQQLFTPFFTTRKDGTGLGLLSCRRIALELGGGLSLYPRHRGGARAVLVLPAPSAALVGAGP